MNEDLAFLYDKHSGYCFITNNVYKFNPHNDNTLYDFLKGKFNYHKDFWNLNNLWDYCSSDFYYKTDLKPQADNTFKEEDIKKFKESFLNELARDRGNVNSYEFLSTNYNRPSNQGAEQDLPWKDGISPYNIAAVKLQNHFDSIAGVNINNIDHIDINGKCIIKSKIVPGVQIQNRIDGVTLTKDGKSVDLQEALIKYFSESDSSSFIHSLAEEKNPQIFDKVEDKTIKPGISSKTIFNLTKVNHPTLDQDSTKLLSECKILALWYLIPEEINVINKEGNLETKKVHFKLLGLAKGKDNQLFHWITDLNNEISVLMQYPAISPFDWTTNLDNELSSLFENL